VIDLLWRGAVGTDGLSRRPRSDAFSMIMADLRLATVGLVLLAKQHAVMGELTSRQCAEVPGELLSRRGYERHYTRGRRSSKQPDEKRNRLPMAEDYGRLRMYRLRRVGSPVAAV
jgi:hypothetical protein